tara:strand:- start:171 stop:938 length:768 start_codon:yes stop_codon:yes gene_type:complete
LEHLKPVILEYQVVRKAKFIIWIRHIEGKLIMERYLAVLERHLVIADLKKEISLVIVIWLLWALVLTSVVFIFGDVGLAASFQNLIKNSVVKKNLAVFTDYALYPFYFIFVCLIGLGFYKNIESFRDLAWRYFIAQLIGSIVLVRLLKMLVARGRPSSEFPSIYIGDFTQLYVDASLHSFPSGHAADVWTGATILFIVAKQVSVKFFLIVVAILVSLSRVALGAHYPIDILVGSLIGLLTGSLCLVISRSPSNKI